MSFDRFIVTGTGRSGTKYASAVFTAMGLKCTHQKVYTEFSDERPPIWDGRVGDASAFAAPKLDAVPDTTLVIHQVRNPWLVVRSLVEAQHLPPLRDVPSKNAGVAYYRAHCDYTDHENPLLRAAHLWWRWNVMIEASMLGRGNYVLHRLEDYTVERVEHLLKLLGYEFTFEMREAFEAVPQTTGSINPRGPVPDLRDMPHGFWGMVNRYGYNRPPEFA